MSVLALDVNPIAVNFLRERFKAVPSVSVADPVCIGYDVDSTRLPAFVKDQVGICRAALYFN